MHWSQAPVFSSMRLSVAGSKTATWPDTGAHGGEGRSIETLLPLLETLRNEGALICAATEGERRSARAQSASAICSARAQSASAICSARDGASAICSARDSASAVVRQMVRAMPQEISLVPISRRVTPCHAV